MNGWQEKAKTVIRELSRESYEAAQRLRNGKRAKKHRPYSIPEVAERLVQALGQNDEELAKAIMMFDYDAQRVWNARAKGTDQ